MGEVARNRQVIETMWQKLEATFDWKILDDIYSADYVRIGDQNIGRSEWYDQLRDLYAAFPDHRMQILVTVAEGDCVAYRWTAEATHKGLYLGAPPTGLTARATGITISRFQNGLIVEEQASWNKLAFLKDLGISTLRAIR